MTAPRKLSHSPILALAIALLFTTILPSSHAQTLNTLYDFGSGKDAVNPSGGLIADAAGNLYGVSAYGGARDRGTVFQLSAAAGGGWTESIIYSFEGGMDGFFPLGQLVMDKAGTLYGVTQLGGDQDESCFTGGCGTVFSLAPPAAPGGSWTESILYRFSSAFGFGPSGGLLLGGNNVFYGTTVNGGPSSRNSGTAFRLAQVNGVWTETILYTFAGSIGRNPDGPLVRDSAGNLYGATFSGGSAGGGMIFQLSPPAKSGGRWTLSTILNLDSSTGTGPGTPLVIDKSGTIYGETSHFGGGGEGNIFQLVPPTSKGGSWTQNILYSFQHAGFPEGGLAFDSSTGTLYGATSQGYGTVFQLSAPSQSGGLWTFTTLHTFTNTSDGWAPQFPLLLDKSGNLFGLTGWGGTFTYGTAFQLTP